MATNPRSGSAKQSSTTSSEPKETAETTTEETNTMYEDAKKFSEDASKRFEENAERIKEFNTSMTESTKAANRLAIDNYETAAKNFFDVQRQLAEASQSKWVQDTTNSQIQIGEQVTNAWVKAARDLLK